MVGEAISTDLDLRWLDDGQRPLDWNGPEHRRFAEFPDRDLDRPILASFEGVAGRYPNRVAVSDSASSLTFAELWDGVSGLAETIEAQTQPGDLIGITLPACSRLPVAMLACWAAGRPFVSLDPHYTSEWTRQVLDDARPALIIEPGTEARTARRGWRPAEFGVDQPACVLFTSGSTGPPKGIVNSQRALLQRVAQSINASHINEQDRFLTLSSLSTIVGVRDTVTALLAGASIHLLDPQRVGAREILHAIRTEAITILFAFPALLRSVVPYAGERASESLRLVRIGGDTTLWSDIDLLRKWLAPEAAIQSIYAATEAPMMQWFVDASCRTDDPRVPIGYPLPGNRLAVIDEDGRNTPPGQTGELIAAGPHVTLGQWVDGHCTQDAGRLFRTGDLVRQRPDGLLERLGRKDRQTKIRGTRVDLDGVEATLRKHPLVRDAGALTRTTGADGAVTLVAYVSAGENAPAWMLEDVKELMQSAPPALRPAHLYLAPEIPRLPGSKLDVRALMAVDAATIQNERAAVAAGSEPDLGCNDRIGQTVAQVWERVLQTPVRGPDDDFFEAGGDSLKAITFVMELEVALSVELPLTIVTEAPKLGRLCDALREHRAARYMPLVPLKAGAGLPPVYFVHDVGGSVAGLLPMARRMGYSGAVIGIQARGLAGPEPPHVSVEAMAAEYLQEIKAWQPEGPYHLCGYSFGGLVAFEMARQLAQSGDQFGLVGLLDTRLSPRRWPLRCWLALTRRRVVQFVSAVRSTPIHQWPATVWKTVSQARESLRSYATATAADGTPVPSFLRYARGRVLNVGLSAVLASARYRPGFYPGNLTLFAAVEREPGLPSLETIWSTHARTLSVVETAGTHSTMLSPANAARAAATLTRLLRSSAEKSPLAYGRDSVSAHTETRP